MVTFTKFGSCVTSDVFNFMNISNYYPKHIYTGINIATAVHKADIPILEEDLVAENGFWEKMQKYCFSHEALDDCIKKWQSDYFIFDLCDERLPLQRWTCGKNNAKIPVNWNTYRTSQNVLNGNNYEEYGGIKIDDWHFADRNKEEYINEIKSFCNSIKKFYPESHIIYIALREADSALDNDGKNVVPIDDMHKKGVSDAAKRKRENLIIDFAESIVKKELKNCWSIKTPDRILADTRHHFGLHPLHFNYLIYEYLANCVEMIVKSEKDTNISQDILTKKIYQNMDMKKYYLELKLESLR